MTFSEKVKREFIVEIPHKTCCRRALAHGVLFDSELEGESIYIDTLSIDFANFYCDLFKRQFAKDCTVIPLKKAGREYYRVSFESKAMATRIASISKSENGFAEYLGIKCETCKMNFMRGVFLARGTLTVSPGNNHLKYRILHRERAAKLISFLTALKIEPKVVDRRGAIGIYYKKADRIEDSLKLIHSVSAIYKVVNLGIERNFSSEANRAANCEAVNIRRAVETAQKQLKAIEIIEGAGGLEQLSEELQQTARLRLENHAATLSELAAMHEPPITKSVLNNRFAKILKLAERITKKD